LFLLLSSFSLFFFLILPPPLRSTLFPYTTLFRSVHSIVVQPDGKIVLAGRFTRLGGQPRNHIGRLFPDGHVDAGFDPGADTAVRSEEHTSELQSLTNLVCRLLLEKKKTDKQHNAT